MKKAVKILSLILALLMVIAVFASCGDKGGDDKDQDKETKPNDTQATTSGDATVTDEVVPDIEVRNWEGRDYRILGREEPGSDWALHFEVYRDEMPEDVVGKEVWNRNLDISKNYGINIKANLVANYNDVAAVSLASGEDLYDLMLLVVNKFNDLTLQGYFLDLKKVEYINLKHDAWLPEINEELTFGDKLFYTSNKFMLQDKNRYFIMYYNRDMAAELNLGHFEDFVFDGTWTLEKMLGLAKSGNKDDDGVAGMSRYDTWGLACSDTNMILQLVVGSGFRYTEKGSDGFPKLIGPTDDMLSRLDKVYDIVASDYFFCDTIDLGSVDYSDCAHQMFYRGKSLLFGEAVSQLPRMAANCNFVYAPLPNPKSDERQEMYYSSPNLNNGSLLGIPSTVVDSEFAGYALELISEKSIDTSYEAFIEIRSLLQSVPDEDSSMCLRIVFESPAYDAGFTCNLGLKYSTGDTKHNYARLFDRSKDQAEMNIERMRKAYAEMN